MTPTRRARIGRPPLVLAACLSVMALLAGAGPFASGASAASGSPGQGPTSVRSVRVPVTTQTLPAAYDPAASYEAQAICSPTPKPGAVKLANLLKKTYGSYSVGITRGCGVGSTSEHKEGRALDWMVGMGKAGHAKADAFLNWLLGPDQAGVAAGNATRLGVMYIGWDDQFWRAYDAGRGWTELDACYSTGDDTSCHRNHVHISLTWDGASGRTSFWDGTALTPYCSASRASAPVVEGGRAAQVTAVAATRVLDTRLGVGLVASSGYGFGGGFRHGGHDGDWVDGSHDSDWADAGTDEAGWSDPGDGDSPWPDSQPTDAGSPWPDSQPTDTGSPVTADVQPAPPAVPAPAVPCRLGVAGWGGSGGVLTKVTGHGGVPDVGVAAVAVPVRVLGSTAPANVLAWGPGQRASEVVATVRMNGRAHGSAIVPVAADGTIALATSAGATDVTVDVTGYFLAGDQPNTPAVD